MGWGNRYTDTKKISLHGRMAILQQVKRLLRDLENLRLQILIQAPPGAIAALAASVALPNETNDEIAHIQECSMISSYACCSRDSEAERDAFSLQDSWFIALELTFSVDGTPGLHNSINSSLDRSMIGASTNSEDQWNEGLSSSSHQDIAAIGGDWEDRDTGQNEGVRELERQTRCEDPNRSALESDTGWRDAGGQTSTWTDVQHSPWYSTSWQQLTDYLNDMQYADRTLTLVFKSNPESSQGVPSSHPHGDSDVLFPLSQLIRLQKTIVEVKERHETLSERADEIRRSSRCHPFRWKLAESHGNVKELLKSKGLPSPLTETLSVDEDESHEQDAWALMEERYRRPRSHKNAGPGNNFEVFAGTRKKRGSTREVIW
ncbi:hypothetical protein HIM_03562 [Hirsutella minnesotensis 3608]|uniref:Uncharacterized protein n=1 Tax=Hirsutella minnesotensis 3608 TaxID=1043627 RepID=A0A0F7ZMH3_9HYPO|nr:hypothetical protein HIM_03562 [Hirsutella minnesotensis 3608]